MSQLLWPHITGAGSISLVNTVVGCIFGQALKGTTLWAGRPS